MKKENFNLLKFSIIFSSIRSIIFTSLIIWVMIFLFKSKDYEGQTLGIGEISIISFSFISLILFYWILNISTIFTFIYSNNSFKQLVLFSILTINIEFLVYSFKNRGSYRFTFIGIGVEIKNKIKPWKTMDIIIMGILLGMYLLFAFTTSFVTETPFWITLPFKCIPLFFGAYILSFSQTFILCFASAGLTVFMPGTPIYNFVQYLFDYGLMIMAVVPASLFKPRKISHNKFTNMLSFSGFIFVPIIIMFFSRTMAGITFWLNPNKWEPFYAIEWSGSVIAYSMLYNSINTTFDLGIYIFTVPQICITLDFIKEKYFNQEQINENILNSKS